MLGNKRDEREKKGRREPNRFQKNELIVGYLAASKAFPKMQPRNWGGQIEPANNAIEITGCPYLSGQLEVSLLETRLA
jgi:hypothetical protein